MESIWPTCPNKCMQINDSSYSAKISLVPEPLSVTSSLASTIVSSSLGRYVSLSTINLSLIVFLTIRHGEKYIWKPWPMKIPWFHFALGRSLICWNIWTSIAFRWMDKHIKLSFPTFSVKGYRQFRTYIRTWTMRFSVLTSLGLALPKLYISEKLWNSRSQNRSGSGKSVSSTRSLNVF